jgi:hypothetical protein
MKPADLNGMLRTVFQACQRNEACKQDDRLLIWTVWQSEYPALHRQPLTLSVFRKLSCPETIRRARQRLQENGLCLPPKPVTEHRQRTAQEFQAELEAARKKTLLF